MKGVKRIKALKNEPKSCSCLRGEELHCGASLSGTGQRKPRKTPELFLLAPLMGQRRNVRERGRVWAGVKVSSRGWCPHSLRRPNAASPFTG